MGPHRPVEPLRTGARVSAGAAVLLFAGPALAAIQGSAHDFSGRLWSGGQVCVVCHTPHDARSGTEAPLWNHGVSNAVYTLYRSPTMAVAAEQPGPGSQSRMCLSCHDGTVAVDSFGGRLGSTLAPDAVLPGTDLSNDHPIGIRWIHQTQVSGSFDCLSCHDVLNPSGPAGKELKFYGGKVECASCHDVHNDKVMDAKLLRKPRSGSQLCLHCHPK